MALDISEVPLKHRYMIICHHRRFQFHWRSVWIMLPFPILPLTYPPSSWRISPHCSLSPKGYRHWGWISKRPQPPRRQPKVPNVEYQMWSLNVGGAAKNLHECGRDSHHICMYIPEFGLGYQIHWYLNTFILYSSGLCSHPWVTWQI